MARLDCAADNDPEMGEGSSYCWQASLTAKNNVSSSFLDAAEMARLALCLGPVTSLLRNSGEWVRPACAESSCCIQCPGPIWEAFELERGCMNWPMLQQQIFWGIKRGNLGSMQVTKSSKWTLSLSIKSCHLSWFLSPYSLFAHPHTPEVPIIISILVFHEQNL